MEKEELDKYFENLNISNKINAKKFKPNKVRLGQRIQLAKDTNIQYYKKKHENRWITFLNDFKSYFLINDYTKPVFAFASILIVGTIIYILINNKIPIINNIDRVAKNKSIVTPDSSEKKTNNNQDSILIAKQQNELNDFAPLNTDKLKSLKILSKFQKEISFGIATKNIDEKILIDSVIRNINSSLDAQLKFKKVEKLYLSEWFYLFTKLQDTIPTRIVLENQSEQILIRYEFSLGSKIKNNSKFISFTKFEKIKTLSN
jgi:hypothetical protein